MTSIQLTEWQAYDRLEPIGEERGDFRMAFQCSLITNMIRKIYGTKGCKMTVPSDFMLEWDKDPDEELVPEKQSVEQMKEVMFGIAGRQNKRIQREQKLNTRPPKGYVKKKTKVDLKT